jgi:Mg2+/citrate symporter
MLSKLLSGRFLLTLAAAWVFVYLCITSKMSPEAATGIISTVFALYFNRNDRTGGDDGKPNKVA